MTRTISLNIPHRVSKHLPNVPEKITLPSVSLPHLSRPQIHLPHLSLASLPQEARRPIYATVGAGDLAVERVREAATAVQERITGAQKSFTDKAGDVVEDNLSAATSTYDEFTRRGAKVMERFWPAAAESSATEQATPATVVTVTKAAPKAAAKTRKSPAKGAAKPATKPAVKRTVKVAPTNVAPMSGTKNTAAKPINKPINRPVAKRAPKPTATSAPTAAPTLKSVQE